MIALDGLKSLRVIKIPDILKLTKFFRLFAKHVFPFSSSLLIVTNRLIDVIFQKKTFLVYREVARYWMSKETHIPVRTKKLKHYVIDYSDRRIYEWKLYRYPKNRDKIESFIIRKILENL